MCGKRSLIRHEFVTHASIAVVPIFLMVQRQFVYNGTTILNSNDFQISMDKHFQVNYQLKAPLSPQPPYPHCVEKGGETHF